MDADTVAVADPGVTRTIDGLVQRLRQFQGYVERPPPSTTAHVFHTDIRPVKMNDAGAEIVAASRVGETDSAVTINLVFLFVALSVVVAGVLVARTPEWIDNCRRRARGD
jgi:hypothetical protein